MIPSSLVFWVIICHHHYRHCTTLLILSSIAYQSLNVVLDEAAGLTNSALRKVCETLVLNGHKIRLFIYGCIFYCIFLATPTFWNLPCCHHVWTHHIFVITYM